MLILHVGSDVLIALAYFSIPFALLCLARKRPDLRFSRLFVLFAVFILACGVTHLMAVWNIWHANYWLSGIMKAITAVASMMTAIMLWRIIPAALQWPSPAQLEQANAELSNEISIRKEAEVQLQEAFDKAPIGKALVSLDGQWINVNPALCHILGYAEDELKQMNFQQITYETDLQLDLDYVAELMSGKRDAYQMEKRYKHKAGHLVWVLLSATVVRDDNKAPRYVIAQILDITYRKLAEEELLRARAELEYRVSERTEELQRVNQQLHETNKKLVELSHTDSMSSLQNRRSLNIHLERVISEASRYDIKFCVMLLDIDNFKHVNDTHGHLQGDTVIGVVGDVLLSHLRETDIAARFGGDEFCVLMPHTSIGRAPAIADKIRQRIEQEVFTTESGEQFTITCSIGIVEYDDSTKNSEKILSRADKALYQAKHLGRNRIEVNR